MSPAKAAVVSRFEKPAQLTLSATPEHKIPDGFKASGVCDRTALVHMNPDRTNAGHKLYSGREAPGFLEEKIGVPFSRVAGEKRRDAALEFQPMLDGRDFNRNVAAEARHA